MYQSGHRHSKRLFKFRLTWPVTLNWGKVVILMTQQELKGGLQLTVLLHGSGVYAVRLEIQCLC